MDLRDRRGRPRRPTADDAKSLVRWGVQHGPPAVLLRLGKRSSDRFAQLASNPALRADPYRFYADVRTAGPVVEGKFALATARYDVVSALEDHRAEKSR